MIDETAKIVDEISITPEDICEYIGITIGIDNIPSDDVELPILNQHKIMT
jgi:hypothetical protein